MLGNTGELAVHIINGPKVVIDTCHKTAGQLMKWRASISKGRRCRCHLELAHKVIELLGVGHLVFPFNESKMHGNGHKAFLRQFIDFLVKSPYKITVCQEFESFIVKKVVPFRFDIIPQFLELIFRIVCHKKISIFLLVNQHMDEIGEIPITKGLITALDGSLFIEVKEEQAGSHKLPIRIHLLKGYPAPFMTGGNDFFNGRADQGLLDLFRGHTIDKLKLGIHFKLHGIA